MVNWSPSKRAYKIIQHNSLWASSFFCSYVLFFSTHLLGNKINSDGLRQHYTNANVYNKICTRNFQFSPNLSASTGWFTMNQSIHCGVSLCTEHAIVELFCSANNFLPIFH